jgi:cardiolipin synthase
MGLANWLTVLRILLIPVFVVLLVYRKPGAALAVFTVAALTDLLDGYVARRAGRESRLGAFLDPMADKLLLVSSFATLTYLKVLPAWIMIVVVSRDTILMLGSLLIHMVGGRIYPRPTIVGKLATFFQILTVLGGLLVRYFRPPPETAAWLTAAIWIAAVFTVVSGLQYLVQGMRYLHATETAEGESRDESMLFR